MERWPCMVTYLRHRIGRHSAQRVIVRSKANLRTSDAAMAKIGFVREGTQLPLLPVLITKTNRDN